MQDSSFGNVAYNRYTNLDGLQWRIINALLGPKASDKDEFGFPAKDSKFVENFWKLLAYSDEECLMKDVPSRKERINLIYRDNGLSTGKRLFLAPFNDDAEEVETVRVGVYIDGINPKNHITSTVTVGIEVIVHNKIDNILGEADEENPFTNPSEIDDGEILIPTKSRAATLVKSILAELNGKFVAGVGNLQHDSKFGTNVQTKRKTYNNKAYIGYEIILATLMSGASDSSYEAY